MVNHRKHPLQKITTFLLALALVASPVSNMGAMSTVTAENVESTISLIEFSGYEEGAYVEWAPVDGADGYLVYVSKDQSEWTRLDDELIRNYGTYMRADALGLTAGKWYVKIEAATFNSLQEKIGTVAECVQEVEVSAHDRSGFAWEGNGTASGAYNEDGSLRENSNVIYITEETKDTVRLEVAGATENPYVGLQAIMDGYKSGTETKPLCIRIIGNVTMPGYMINDDLRIEGISVGITVEGVGEDAVANGWGIYMVGSSNVEVRNLAFMNRSGSGEGDNVGVQGNNDHVWVHHCDMFYGLPGEDEDQVKGDGALDCKSSAYVTFSYNHFWDSGKTSLLGMDEDNTEELCATYHHNWFDHSDQRHPYVSSYSVHVYNNYYDGNFNYGIGAKEGSSVFVENNYFRNCRYPILTTMQGSAVWNESAQANDYETVRLGSDPGGVVKAYNNYMEGQRRFVVYSATDDPDTAWNDSVDYDAYVAASREEQVPSTVVAYKGGATYNNFDTADDFYEYILTETAEVPSVVMAGAGRLNGGDFTWEFNDPTDDKSSDVDGDLREACENYTSKLVSVGGVLGASDQIYYTVTFEPGNGEETTQVEVEVNKKVEEPAAPVTIPTGKVAFGGWYNGANKWNFSNPVTGDMTLTAKWLTAEQWINPDELYNLRLNVGYIPTGTYSSSISRNGFTVNIGGGSGQNVLVDSATKTINGISYTQRMRFISAGTKDYRSIVFTAKEAATLEIGCLAANSSGSHIGVATLDESGNFVDWKGTATINGVATDCSDGNIPVSGAETNDICVEIPEAGTYYIYGKDGGMNFFFVNLLYEDGVEAPCFTASFDAVGGLSVDKQEVMAQDTCIKPAATLKSGYVFAGWYSDETCGTAYDFDTPVTENITLYAKWTKSETQSTSLLLDMRELPVRDYKESFNWNDFTINATSERYLSVEANSVTVEGTTYPYRLKLNGTGSTAYRNISFTIDDEATLTLVAASGSSTAARALTVTNGTTTHTISNIGDAAKFTQELTAGTWYVYSAQSGVNLYYIEVVGEETPDQPIGDVTVSESNGYEEGAYVEWAPVDGADGYLVYVSQDQSSWTQIDDELIRNYGTYMRADALGLTAGKWYVKIEAATFDTGRAKTGTVAETVQEVDVVAHDRSGYAWEGNGTSSGAYNEDGSLREDANVIYITEATKDTVSLEVTGAAMNPCVGLQDILEEYRDGEETKPLCIRVIGNITTPSYTSDDDILIDGITVGMTLEGVGEDAVANGWGIYIKNSSNVEVRNMAFMNRSMNGSQDTVGLQENNDHIWVHHCDMFYGGVGSETEQDKGDGALDCKDSTYVTVSYNHLWDTGLSCLLGLSEGTTEGLYATYHHNWFDHSDGRHPRVRYYSTHVYNNYYDGNYSYGVGSTMGSSIFVENNYFRNCYHPIMTSKQGTDVYGGRTGNFSGEDGGTVKAFNNYMTGQRRFVAYREVDDPATDWNETTDFDAYVATSRDERVPESVVSLQGGNTYNNFDTAADFYEYQLTETENVPAVVMAGAGRVNGGDFKWEFDDATADKSSNVDEELRAACLAYTSDLLSVGGILGSSTTAYYTVTFDPGNGEATSSVEVEAYQTVNEPQTPTVVPEGKDFFAGWYNGATKWDFADPVTSDMTLNGKWLVEGEGLNPAVLYNLRLNLKNVPTGTYTAPFTRGGFTVNAWSSTKRDVVVDANTKSINGTSYTRRLKLYGAGTKDYRNIVFTAKAAAELQIGCMANSSGTYQMGVATLDENGDFVDLKGTVNVDGVARDCSDGNIPVTSASAQYITLEIPEAGTYYIYGKDGGINFYFLNLIYENGVEAPCYTVSFDAMGGLSVNAQEVVVGERGIKPADTFRDGYVFGGWYEDAAWTTAYHFSAPVTSDITLYAKWIEDETEGANLILDMQELPVRDYTENFGKNGFSFYASASKYLSVDASSVTVEGVKYPQRLRLNGAGSVSERSISFTIDEESTLTLVAASGNTDEARSLIVTDGTTAYTIADISSAAKFTQTLTAGTWYVYSSRSGINIYYIAVQASGGDVSDGDVSDGDVTDGDPDGGSKPLPDDLYVELANPGEAYVYTGSAIKPAIIVYNNGEELTAGVHYTVKYSNNTNVSTAKKSAKITVTGKDNLTGSNSTTFKILPKDIGDDDIVEGAIVVAKNSKATPVLMYNNKKLTTKNYTIEDAKKKYTEDGVMKLTGKGNFTGTREIPVKVVEKSELKKFTVTVGKEKLTYNGEEQRPTITVKDKKDKTKVLEENEDYIIEFGTSNVNAGIVKFTVIGIGEYTGTVAKSYKIKPIAVKEGISFDAESINADGYTFVSNGVKIDEDIVVKYGDTELVKGKDYKVTYSNNKKVSTTKSQAKFTISFLGNYKGSKALKGTFKINSAPLSNDTDGIKIVVADKVYTKKNVYKSAPIVTINGVTLKASNYKVTYHKTVAMSDADEITGKNKIELGENETFATVYVKIVGKGNYAPVNANEKYATAEYKVVKKAANDVDLSKARVTFVDAAGEKLTKEVYTGKEIEPKVKVEVKQKVNGKTGWVPVDSTNYEVVYVSNVNKGTATAVITATGEGYVGSKTAKFKIGAKNLNRLPDLLNELFGIL